MQPRLAHPLMAALLCTSCASTGSHTSNEAWSLDEDKRKLATQLSTECFRQHIDRAMPGQAHIISDACQMWASRKVQRGL